MTAEDPLHVSFRLPDEEIAHWLDLLIARSGLTPDGWFVDFLARDREETLANAGQRLAQILTRAAENAPSRGQITPGPERSGPVPPRPAAARAARPSSDWRTRG